MNIQSHAAQNKDIYIPKQIELSEEEIFFAKIDSGEIKVKSNEEVLENLAKVLGLK